MAILIEPIELELTSAQLLTMYTGALVYVYSSATEDGTFSLLGTTAIVSGTESYSYIDDAPVNGDDTWYKTRVGNATASDFSGYSDAFQTGTSEDNAYVTPNLLKDRASITDTLDDDVLWPICDEVNRELHSRIGVFIGPSSDTTRTYDGAAALRNGSRLYIPGGIRTLTAVDYDWVSNSTSTAGTLADFRLGPQRYSLAPGEPYQWVEFVQYPTSLYMFPPYTANILLTGTFGWTAVPADLQGVAIALATRKHRARNVGGQGYTAAMTFGDGQIYPFLTAPEMVVVDRYAREVHPMAA